ncbi:MAG: chemotaxis protein CheR [Firmicutes bacterium HGW-Firmicutes-12]|jgi:chemotaxis protein methyltransferase CheR|nr:MAG: chemotaxis protein CheR [Firmicutes bacterium HGW-Firmicutes-12]
MDEYTNFIFDLKKRLDIDLTGYKRPQMERRINSLMRTLSIKDYDSFVSSMKQDGKLLERFIDHLTINVSEFFRNTQQWEVLDKKIIPMLLEKTPNLNIWSAGCSTGEEPYTLAMVLAEKIPKGKHSIIATDFDDLVLKKAIAGLYKPKVVSGIPAPYLKKYFNDVEGEYQANDALKSLITFKHHNLLRDAYPSQMDLIICRNVVIYFTEETKSMMYKKMFDSLKPGGVLFTGSTEQIFQARDIGFESSAVFFYRKPL